MSAVIEVQNLVKNYQSRKNNLTAVNGVSFKVDKGEVFGILGPNGAGKTTTLEIIEGLKTQTSGVVRVLGLDNIAEEKEIKKRIGVQLQSSEYLPLLSLKELLQLFSSFYSKTANVKELLSFVELEDKKDAEVKNLSGGQKQRFTLATSLVNEPEILFLDEPTTGLDPRARRHVWELIRQINTRGIAIVLTTHYMEEAEYLCNRVAIMDHGKILKIDNPKTLINDLLHTTQVSFLTNQPIQEIMWHPLKSDIQKIYSNFPKVILDVSSLDIITSILEILKQNNITFSGFTVKTATLEDVYLDLTGREFEE